MRGELVWGGGGGRRRGGEAEAEHRGRGSMRQGRMEDRGKRGREEE